jgi:hypothetical protein
MERPRAETLGLPVALYPDDLWPSAKIVGNARGVL